MPNYRVAPGGTFVRAPDGQNVFLFDGLPLPEYVVDPELQELIDSGRVIDDESQLPPSAPSPQGVGDSWYGSTTTDVSGTTGVAVTFDTNYGAEVDSFTSAPLTVVDACVLAITIAVQVNTGTGAATLKIGDLPNGPTVVVSKTLDGTESSDERILFLEVTSLVTAGYVPKFSYAAPAGLSYAECSVSRVT